ncbi:MAG TPA: tRNA (N(6)-L-threonylcarbamoyladenosine(37)-C(2))-methylthiotransferase MtaB, partial [Clostridiales bacterium]|nr:tRNA (N(6)-L-threonylcarbamoyladenosine(37)-C(2))-methylthiotransferase MtaB [Clostridiales bacterium]
AGFATETEKDFEDSLSIIEEVGFARVHAFAFSPREGTVAYKLKDVPPQIKSERLHRLLKAAEKCAHEYSSKFIGGEAEIIAETYEDGYSCGYTCNYIRVYVPSKLISGRKYKVKIVKLYKDGVIAEANG